MAISDKIYNFRQWTNEHPKIVIPIVAAIVIVAIIWGVTVMRGPQPMDPGERDAFYYDLETREVFKAPADRIPPFERDNGHMAVRAVMYKEPGAPDEEAFVAYLQKLSAEARENPSMRYELPGEGLLIRRPDDDSWHPAVGQYYEDILAELDERGAVRARAN